MKKPFLCVFIILFSCCFCMNFAQAITYDFIKVAESQGTDDESLRGAPSISNNGLIAYYDHYTIYKYTGSTVNFFTAIRSAYSSISFYPSINSAGTVAFGVFSINGRWGIVSKNGSFIKNIINNESNEYSYIGSSCDLNDIGYASGWAKRSNTQIIYLSNGISLVNIADTSGIYHTLLEPALNNNNVVAFTAYYTGGCEIVASDGISSDLIATSDGPFDLFNFGEIDINDLGEVAFRATLDDGGEAIVLADKSKSTLIADTFSRFESFYNGGFDGVSVTNTSEVVFWAKEAGREGIYIGNGACVQKVIAAGDQLNGDRVVDLLISNSAINDGGQIVFKATLQKQDNSMYRVIYFANPSGKLEDTDTDKDGLVDCMDNCPEVANDTQEDMDNDGIGDGCDRDMDGDGFDSVFHGGQDANDTDDQISPDIEQGPDGTNLDYDGNGDGVPDRSQDCVQSLHGFENSGYLTLAAPEGQVLGGIRVEGHPASEEAAPSEPNFPYGFFSFSVHGVTPGSSTTVSLFLPAGSSPSGYYKYGPTPTNTTPHWYEFMYDNETGTGAVISGNTITLHFVDGLRGDDDLDATNGIVVDLGAPVGSTVTPQKVEAGGGGGGCFIEALTSRL
jgi:hypothetical protein